MTLEPYIQGALDTEGKWKSPSTTTTSHMILHETHGLPMLEIEDWKMAFDTATENQKRNLADAWVWNFAVRTNTSDFGYLGDSQAASIDHNAKWIQQIEPYANFSRADKDAHLEKCKDLLFIRGVDQVSEMLRPLWFGSTHEKLILLLELQSDEENLYQLVNTKYSTSYNRIWEAASQPEATQQHRQAAAYITATIGQFRTRLVVGQSDIFENWYEFGDICSRGRPVGPEAISRLKKAEAFIKEQDPMFALPVFVKLTKVMLEEDYSLEQLSYPFAKNKCHPLSEDPYAVLRHWFPAYSEQWGLAESIGMNYVDAALVAVERARTSENIKSSDLPSDISPG